LCEWNDPWRGDHSFKAGFKYGHYGEVYDRTYSGHAQAVFNSARPLPIFSTPFTARLIRDFITPAFFDQKPDPIGDRIRARAR
jgi:hypothetical protein